MLTEIKIKSIADDVLLKILGSVVFDRTKIEAKSDHDAEDALYVTVIFKPGAPVTSGKTSADAMEALVDTLSAEGEMRFPYFIYEYPDDERPYELISDDGDA